VAPPTIEARGLYHIYREKDVETVALRGADIVLEAGDWTAIHGPSGSGKSTLLQVLAGILEPSGGSVVTGGLDITRLPPPDRARWRLAHVGVVLQRDNLHPLLNVADNVALPLRLQGRPRGECRTRVDSLLEKVGLASRRKHLVAQLSGGEAQRVAVAVALATGPKLLLADEPTGELDEATAVPILDLLAEFCSEEGCLLTVTHNRQVAERARRVFVMRDGELHRAA